jgi:hypothetical protein
VGVLSGRRRLFQFLPLDLAEPNIQSLPCAHQTRPRLAADELHAGSIIGVHEVSTFVVADVSAESIKQRLHDDEKLTASRDRKAWC